MKIAVIAADLLPGKLGGAEAHAVEVIKRLSKNHRIFLFVGRDDSIKNILLKSVTVYPIHYPQIPNLFGICYLIFAYPQIKKILAGLDFDFLWAKQCYPQAPLGALLKRHFNKPLYVTAQNPLLHQQELVLKGFLKPFHNLLSSLLTPLISWSLKSADLVACVSKYSENLAKKMGVKKTVIIPNGVDLKKFSLPKRKKAKTIRILTTSSLIPRNGIDTLIEALSLLPKSLDFTLNIAGDGPEREKLIALAKSHKLKNKVKFFGRVRNNQIPNLLSKADVYVRPSRREGFGVSFLEAMAAGVPVIATPVGGITDFLNGGRNGLLVEPDNPQQLSQAIAKLISNRELAEKLITQAKKTVVNHYSWDRIAYEVENKFYKLL